jgi:4-diphosphocytidyl-2-C-methyl-D-erythritol kinase
LRRATATAKINLALVVGPSGDDGRHEVTTVLQRIDLCDRIAVSSAQSLTVRGFPEDTLVQGALISLAKAVGVEPSWAVRIVKRIPAAAGLGGGSSDAATALRLANETLGDPLSTAELSVLASELGADVPFFLAPGPQLGEGDGARLRAVDLPQDYWVVLVLPADTSKRSTGAVYEAFDARGGAEGHEHRRTALLRTLAEVRRPRDLASLPPNDLASSPLAQDLRDLGAFRADVTGAGPAVYGLFQHRAEAQRARRSLRSRGRTWLVVPTWYF